MNRNPYKKPVKGAALATQAFNRAWLKINHDALIEALSPNAPIVLSIDGEPLSAKGGMLLELPGNLANIDSAFSFKENVGRLRDAGVGRVMDELSERAPGKLFSVLLSGGGASTFAKWAMHLTLTRIYSQRATLREQGITVRQALVAGFDSLATELNARVPGLHKEAMSILAARLKTRRNRLIKRRTLVNQEEANNDDAFRYLEVVAAQKSLRFVGAENVDRLVRAA
jgi:hypothetical protein